MFGIVYRQPVAELCAGSLVDLLDLLGRLPSVGVDVKEMQGLLPALRVALVIVSLSQCSWKPLLLLQKADGHFQDVSFLQLGVWVLAAEFLLQQLLQLIDAIVDAVSAHLFYHWLSQL